MWGIAHAQGIRLPTKDYWEFRELITVSPRRGRSFDGYLQLFHWTELIQSSPIAVERSVYEVIGGAYRKNNITTANAAVDKSLQHNYIGRKEKKRNFRALWIQRINAAVREHGLTYSRFIAGLAGAGIVVDRKVLSDLAIHEPVAFKALVEQASKA